MLEARTINISVARDWRELYEAIWQPESFPKWASGLSRSNLRRDGETWRAEGPDGAIRIRFTAHNPFGIMDHHVELAEDREVYVPLRIIRNGAGAEVLLTLFRQPGMSDEVLARDIDWVRRDLAVLREMAEA